MTPKRLAWENERLIRERGQFLPELGFLREENRKLHAELEDMKRYEAMIRAEYVENNGGDDREKESAHGWILLRAMMNDLLKVREIIPQPTTLTQGLHTIRFGAGMPWVYDPATEIKILREVVYAIRRDDVDGYRAALAAWDQHHKERP